MNRDAPRKPGAVQSLDDVRAALEQAANGHLHDALDPDRVDPALSPLVRALNQLIERQRTAVEARERSEARYRALVEEGHAVVYVLDIRHGVVHVMMDAKMEALLGLTAQEWQADLSLLAQRLHPEDRERVLTAKMRCIGRGETLNIEYRFITRHGATLWVHDHATVERDGNGAPLRMHGVAMNITTRRRFEEALYESEGRFDRMARRLPHVIFRWSAKGLEYISPACLQMFGRTPGELLRYLDPRDLLIHPDDRERVSQLATGLMGGPVHFETRVLRPNGDTVWTEQNLSPIFDSNGWLVAVEGVACDISERKRMEIAVRESEELFHTLAKLAPVGIFRTDAFGRSMYINEHGCRIVGRPYEDAVGLGWTAALHPEDKERMLTEWREVIQSRLPFRSEYRFQHASGRVVWVLGEALPETNATGEFRGYVGTITDITDRKRAELDLLDTERAKREAASTATDDERRRLARELHDGALQDLGAIKLLLEIERKQERRECIDLALDRLTTVITELRTVVDNLQPGDLSRASLQEAIAAHARWLGRPHGISIALELDPLLRVPPASVRDLYRIAQEALANAVLHGDPSHITVRLIDQPRGIVLEVEDDGSGFDVSALEHGMGLVSMRERAAALGGDFELTSVHTRGTCVRVAIPRNDANDTDGFVASTAVLKQLDQHAGAGVRSL